MSASNIDSSKKVAVLATFQTQGRCTNWRGWVQVLDATFPEWAHWDGERMDKGTQDSIIAYEPDILLVLLPIFLKLNLKEIKQSMGCMVIFYYADYTLDLPYTQYTQYIDHMFLSNRDQIPAYRETFGVEKVHYLPMSCYKMDPHKIELNCDLLGKIVFVGAIYDPKTTEGIHVWRSQLWHVVLATFKDRMININEPEYPARNDVYDSLPQVYNSAQYSLNMDARLPGMDGYTSNRIWAILNLNGLCVTNKFKGMEELGLKDGENCIVFDNPTELAVKINHYDNEPELRDKIRKAGYDMARKNHTHFNRIEQMFGIINESR